MKNSVKLNVSAGAGLCAAFAGIVALALTVYVELAEYRPSDKPTLTLEIERSPAQAAVIFSTILNFEMHSKNVVTKPIEIAPGEDVWKLISNTLNIPEAFRENIKLQESFCEFNRHICETANSNSCNRAICWLPSENYTPIISKPFDKAVCSTFFQEFLQAWVGGQSARNTPSYLRHFVCVPSVKISEHWFPKRIQLNGGLSGQFRALDLGACRIGGGSEHSTVGPVECNPAIDVLNSTGAANALESGESDATVLFLPTILTTIDLEIRNIRSDQSGVYFSDSDESDFIFSQIKRAVLDGDLTIKHHSKILTRSNLIRAHNSLAPENKNDFPRTVSPQAAGAIAAHSPAINPCYTNKNSGINYLNEHSFRGINWGITPHEPPLGAGVPKPVKTYSVALLDVGFSSNSCVFSQNNWRTINLRHKAISCNGQNCACKKVENCGLLDSSSTNLKPPTSTPICPIPKIIPSSGSVQKYDSIIDNNHGLAVASLLAGRVIKSIDEQNNMVECAIGTLPLSNLFFLDIDAIAELSEEKYLNPKLSIIQWAEIINEPPNKLLGGAIRKKMRAKNLGAYGNRCDSISRNRTWDSQGDCLNDLFEAKAIKNLNSLNLSFQNKKNSTRQSFNKSLENQIRIISDIIGVPVVVAAGNAGNYTGIDRARSCWNEENDNTNLAPGCVSSENDNRGIISVVGLEKNGEKLLGQLRGVKSNFGPWYDVAAIAEQTVPVVVNRKTEFVEDSGTSYAAPLVSALAAELADRAKLYFEKYSSIEDQIYSKQNLESNRCNRTLLPNTVGSEQQRRSNNLAYRVRNRILATADFYRSAGGFDSMQKSFPNKNVFQEYSDFATGKQTAPKVYSAFGVVNADRALADIDKDIIYIHGETSPIVGEIVSVRKKGENKEYSEVRLNERSRLSITFNLEKTFREVIPEKSFLTITLSDLRRLEALPKGAFLPSRDDHKTALHFRSIFLIDESILAKLSRKSKSGGFKTSERFGQLIHSPRVSDLKWNVDEQVDQESGGRRIEGGVVQSLLVWDGTETKEINVDDIRDFIPMWLSGCDGHVPTKWRDDVFDEQ